MFQTLFEVTRAASCNWDYSLIFCGVDIDRAEMDPRPKPASHQYKPCCIQATPMRLDIGRRLPRESCEAEDPGEVLICILAPGFHNDT